MFPQLNEIGLQREPSKTIKANGLVETGMKNPFTKPNHPDLGEENNKTQVNRDIRECDCCGGEYNTFYTLKQDIHPTREPFCPSEGNIHNFNDRANKNPDGLTMSIGHTLHKQIRQQWSRAIAKKCLSML